MKIRLTVAELKEWIKDNTNEKNDCLKNLYYFNMKVIKINCDINSNDIFIFQIEDGRLNYENYYYRRNDITDFYEKSERWRAEKDEKYYQAYFVYNEGDFGTLENVEKYYNSDNKAYTSGNYFRTQKEAQKFADDLSEAVGPLFEKCKNGEYDYEKEKI
ncbi:hypothetical protein [Pseudostreptobacillus hongkongensis]|uniref:hypothetical protein n=1 Tax=Pseudostreptobacillus hongkongensis TaxID=1162717 RepID=UPI000829585A|nr:hypothetical protein [Pseudostreptobacillus hongkongensis]